jgi:hypothetical protein
MFPCRLDGRIIYLVQCLAHSWSSTVDVTASIEKYLGFYIWTWVSPPAKLGHWAALPSPQLQTTQHTPGEPLSLHQTPFQPTFNPLSQHSTDSLPRHFPKFYLCFLTLASITLGFWTVTWLTMGSLFLHLQTMKPWANYCLYQPDFASVKEKWCLSHRTIETTMEVVYGSLSTTPEP